MNVGIIPARGGSSLKDKNLRTLLGKPLIQWIVEAAKGSNLDRVIVSSDSGDILRAADCEVFMRPPEISGSKSPSEEAVNHVIDHIGVPDKTLLLQCTTPTTTSEDINAIINLLDEYDSVFMAWPSDALIWDGNVPQNHSLEKRAMRQDRMMLEESGIYGWRGRVNNRFSGNIGVHVADKGIDINDEIDFPLAEVYLRNRQQPPR